MTVAFHLRSQGYDKFRSFFASIISQSSKSIWMKFGILLMMKFILILSHLDVCGFVHKVLMLASIQKFTKFWCQLMILTYIQGDSCLRNQKLLRSLFLQIVQCFVFCVINIQGREHCLRYFVKYSLTLVYVQMLMNQFISMMIDTTAHYILIPVWMTLICTEPIYFYDDRHYHMLHFDTSLNDLDLHWRSQGYKKVWTCAISLL